MPGLESDERHRFVRLCRRAERIAAFRAKSGRNIRRNNVRAARVYLIYKVFCLALDFAVESDAEKSVRNDGITARIGCKFQSEFFRFLAAGGVVSVSRIAEREYVRFYSSAVQNTGGFEDVASVVSRPRHAKNLALIRIFFEFVRERGCGSCDHFVLAYSREYGGFFGITDFFYVRDFHFSTLTAATATPPS